MRIPRKVALIGATATMLALIPASSATAYSAAEKKAEKRQNDRIKKLSKDLSAAKNKLLANDVTDAAQSSTLTSLNTRIGTIEGAVPTVLKGLTDLADAAKQLKTGLETAGAGLVSLQKLATSTEYGTAQLFVGGTPIAGGFIVTPDIPDAVQQAQVTGSFNAGANTGAITIQVAVRSAESDGDGTVAAAHCRVTGTDQAGRIVTSIPNAGLGGAPFYPIATKSAQTSTDAANAGFPFGPKSVGADADNLVNLTNVGTNAAEPLGATNVAAASNVLVQLSCVDTTPSTTDPTA